MLPRMVTSKDGKEIVIRHIVEQDAALYLRLLNDVCAEEEFMLRSRFNMTVDEERDFIRNLRTPNLFIVAEHSGMLVGWVTLFRHSAPYCQHVVELGMGLKKGFRGIGIGSALMQTILEWVREAGIEKVTLTVRASNTVAQRLYEKFGFVREGTRTRQVKHKGQYDDDYQMAYFVLTPDATGGS